MSGQVWLLSGVTSVLMCGLVYFFFSKTTTHIPTLCSLGLIISGGIGNLIDRFFRADVLFHGKVVDYIDFRLINFAIFNVADVFVVCGGILLVIYTMFFDVSGDKNDNKS